MFEKEAENYSERTMTEVELEVLNTVHDWGQESLSPNERRLFNGIQDRKEAREQGFKDGAEFGYNKANEWHYMKDVKPKDNEYVLIYTDLKNTYVARIPTEKDYFITRRGGFVQMSAVIAWKEIVLPELKESE